jgi:hypothetical protein
MKDDVALGAARVACPAPSASVSTQKGVICARIHGLSADAVTKRLEKTCEKDAEAGECDDLEGLVTLALERPPLVIPAAP